MQTYKNRIGSKVFIRNYLIFTFLIVSLHFALLYLRYELSLLPAMVDAMLTVVLLNGMLLSLWFVVRYARNAKITSASSIRNSMAAGLMLIGLWLLFSQYLLKSLFYQDEEYLLFLNQSQELRFAAGLFIAGLVYLSFFLSLYQRSVEQALERENELKIMVQQTALQALKNQLNPHFIYNSLNSISSLTIYSPEKAREMLGLLSDFLRVALRQDAMNLIPLKEELQNIQLYLSIEKIRFEEKLNWDIHAEPDVMDFPVPALVLQPLFENAVKHGVQQSSNPGKIQLISQMTAGNLELTVENLYDAQFHRFKGEGVGLENVRNRLHLIYRKSGLLKINTYQGVFSITLTIPGQSKEEE